jgi:hypothetical protein
MLPAVGLVKPPIMRKQVVLPEPDGPSNVKNSPAAISSVTSSTARTERPEETNTHDTLFRLTACVMEKLRIKPASALYTSALAVRLTYLPPSMAM